MVTSWRGRSLLLSLYELSSPQDRSSFIPQKQRGGDASSCFFFVFSQECLFIVQFSKQTKRKIKKRGMNGSKSVWAEEVGELQSKVQCVSVVVSSFRRGAIQWMLWLLWKRTGWACVYRREGGVVPGVLSRTSWGSSGKAGTLDENTNRRFKSTGL